MARSGTTARTRAVFLVILAIVGVLAHVSLRRGEYVQDDHLAVEHNLIVARGDVHEIFGTSYWAGAKGDDRSLYRPVTILSFALERALSGSLSAPVSRWLNILLHVTAAAVLVLLSRRIGASPGVAWSAGLLFAVHPARFEAVASVVGRAEILAALFSWLALWLFTWAGDTPGSPPAPLRRRAAAWGSAACVFLALGAKEGALALPLLLIGYQILFRPRAGGAASRVDRLGALAPSALAVVGYMVLRIGALETLVSLQAPHEMDNPLVHLTGVGHAFAALGLLARYVSLLVFPVKLSAEYSGPVIPLDGPALGPWAVAGTLLAAVLLATLVPPLVRCARRGPEAVPAARRRVTFALLLFAAPYLVIGNLFFDIGTLFAERLLYMPAAGFCLLLALGTGAGAAARVRGGARAGGLLAVLIVFFLCAAFTLRSWSRGLDWRDDETIFTAAIATHPTSPRANYIVGKLRASGGDLEGGLALLRRSTELYPDYVSAWHETGVVLATLARYDEAAEAFRHTVRLSPRYASAHYNLGAAQRRLGNVDAAARSLRKAIACDPRWGAPWAELGNIRLALREYPGAVEAYRRAIALGRTDLVERLALAEHGAAGTVEKPR